MLNKIIYGLGLAVLIYFAEKRGYEKCRTVAAKSIVKYANEHKEETFEEFLRTLEEKG